MKEKNKLLIIILVLVVLIGGSAILYNVFKDRVSNEKIPDKTPVSQSQNEENDEEETTKVIPAPDFTVLDENGNEVTLSSLKGKPVVLNFWASWCGPCKIEMQDFDKAYSKYKDDIHFAMVNLTDGRRETIKTASKYIEEQGFSFPIYFDTEYEASNAYRVYSVPTTYFIDSEGNLVVYVNGLIDGETLQKGINMIHKDTNE